MYSEDGNFLFTQGLQGRDGNSGLPVLPEVPDLSELQIFFLRSFKFKAKSALLAGSKILTATGKSAPTCACGRLPPCGTQYLQRRNLSINTPYHLWEEAAGTVVSGMHKVLMCWMLYQI